MNSADKSTAVTFSLVLRVPRNGGRFRRHIENRAPGFACSSETTKLTSSFRLLRLTGARQNSSASPLRNLHTNSSACLLVNKKLKMDERQGHFGAY